MNEKPTPAEKLRQKHDAIVALTDEFARARLDEEYRLLFRRLADKLARKRPSPLVNGTAAAWAAGVVRAIGWVNFLHDPAQPIHVRSAEVDRAFGVSTATGQAKSKAIRDMMRFSPLDPAWTLPSQMDKNPMAWMVSVNGIILDVRDLPRELQEEAAARGLIPYLPGSPPQAADEGAAEGDDERAEAEPPRQPAKRRRRSRKAAGGSAATASAPRLYTLDVFIISGLLTDAFVRENRVLSRTIQIRGDQTLADLHRAIFDAFDRFDEHMYEFQLGGKGPGDSNARRYVLPSAMGFDDGGRRPAGRVDETTIASLGLEVGDAFGYWFDFGDDWWHQINVVAIDEGVPNGKFPRVTKRVGESPPQYPEFDEDGDEEQ
jgi:hypothetical protein